MKPVTRAETAGGAWLGHGAIGGLLGGAVFGAFEVALAWLALGASSALLPARMAAGILLGRGAVDPSSPAVPVVIAGALVHVTLSAAFGVVFASIRRPPSLLAALAYGCGLWLVNFSVIAPLAGWEWFARTHPVTQLIGHALLFAPVVGLYLRRADARGRRGVLDAIEPAAPLRRAA